MSTISQQTIDETGVHRHQVRAQILLKWPCNVAEQKHQKVVFYLFRGKLEEKRASAAINHKVEKQNSRVSVANRVTRR